MTGLDAVMSDTASLRRTIRDLAALAALPNEWLTAELPRGLRALAELVRAAVRARFVYVRLELPDGTVTEACGTEGSSAEPGGAEALGRHLATQIDFAAPDFPALVRAPEGDRLRLLAAPVTSGGQLRGWVLAAAAQASFPSEEDRLLLETGAAQVAVLLQRDNLDALRRAQAVQAQASEARTDQLMQLMPAAVCACDAEGRVTFFNRRARELLGREPLPGETWPQFAARFRLSLGDGPPLPPDGTPMQQAMRHGRSFRELEVRITRPDGTAFEAQCNIAALPGADGRPTAVVSVFQDVTARKRAERDAAMLAELGQELSLLGDESALLLATTRRVARHLGVRYCYFAEHAAGGAVRIAHAWPDDAAARAFEGEYALSAFARPERARAALRTRFCANDVRQHPLTREFAARLSDLGLRSLAWAPAVSDGRWTAALVVGDENPRRWSDAELKLLDDAISRAWPIVERVRTTAAWRESEERVRVLADSIAAITWTADARGEMLWFNQRWYEYTGTTPEEMKRRGWEHIPHPAHLDRARRRWSDCVASGTPWEETLPLRGRDGTYRWFLARAAPLRDATGRIVRWFGINTDITELRATQETLQRRTRMLEMLNRTAVALGEEREPAQIVTRVTAAGREITGAAFGAFFPRTGDTGPFVTTPGASADAPPFPVAEAETLVARVLRPGAAGSEARDAAPAGGTLRSHLVAPVKPRSGEVLGALFFGDPRDNVFTSETEAAVAALAAQTAHALDNARLYAALADELARVREAEMSHRRLAAIVESSADAIIAKDLNGIVTSWNAAAERIFGYTAAEMIGQPVTRLIPAERHNEEPMILGRLRRGERVEHYETVRQRKDGSLIDVSLTVSPIKDRHGVVIGASKIARDVTQRRRAEEQHRALFDLLANVNRAGALPDIYDAALDAIMRALRADRASILLYDQDDVMRDPDDVMRFVASRGLSAAYRSAVEGHSPWRRDDDDAQPVCIPNLAGAEIADPLRATIAAEGIRALAFFPVTYQKRLIGKFMVYFNAPHVFDPEELLLGEAIATQVAFAIQRRRGAQALESLVRERTASLRQAIEQMEEFSYSVSHDLRSPARAMRGYAEALLEDYRDRLGSEGAELLARIQRSSARMDRLIQDLLTYSRVSRRELSFEPVAVEKLLEEVVQQYPELQSPRATIERRTPLPRVLAHEPSLSQVVSNLLSNAVKFVAPGTHPRVSIRAERRREVVRLWFEDNGIGIAPEYQTCVFSMFERVHPHHRYEGTGIGLAIVRKAIERMNGRVGVESDGRSGSRFWIELPAAPQN